MTAARVALLFAVVAALPARARAQSARCDPTDRVRALSIDGATLDETLLLEAIATQRPGVLPRLTGFGTFPCLDEAEVRRDALRLAVLHRQRGWYRAEADVRLERRRDGVRVRFTVVPGPRATLDTVRVAGVPAPDDGATDAALALRELRDAPADLVAIERAVSRTLGRLRDRGYARAREETRTLVLDSAAGTAALTVAIASGPRLRVGAVVVEREGINGDPPSYTAPAIRRLGGIRTGDWYSEAELADAQRALYRSEAFRFVNVDTIASDGDTAGGTIDVRLRVAESRTRSARVGIGWGTLECGRTQLRLVDRGFLGPSRRVEFTARASRLGIGAPVDVAPALCPQYLRDDPFSRDLNYFAGITLSNRSFFGLDVAPLVNVYSERRGEPYAFSRETDLGVSLALSRPVGERSVLTGGVSYETGRTQTSPVIGCVRFGLCQLLDLLLVAPGNTTRALDLGFVHDRTGGLVDPRDGVRVRADLRTARTSIALLEALDADAAAWNLYRPALDLTGFTRLGGGVLAARVNWTRVYAPDAPDVDGTPFLLPQERIFSGGQNSVRGYQQNLLGPIVYTVDRRGVDSIPIGDSFGFLVRDDAEVTSASPEGGIGAVTASLEWRRRFPWPSDALQWAVFADAGAVWLETNSLPRAADLRVTPGVGVRLDTPIGPFRVDVGYNPRQRETGKAFVIDSLGQAVGESRFRVLCVSQTEVIPVDAEGLQAVCPRTFTPRSGRSLLSRLVFHFSLGQAF